MASTVREIVVFGPYLGELGHEVRAWAPHVRHCISELPKGQTPIVISKPGHSVLYPLGVQYIPFDLIAPRPSDFMFLSSPPGAMDVRRIALMLDALHSVDTVVQHIRPERGRRYALELRPRADFQLLVPSVPADKYVVGIFARDRQDAGVARNLGSEFWNEAIERAAKKLPRKLHFVFLGYMPGNLSPAACTLFSERPTRCWHCDHRGSGEYALGETVRSLKNVNVVWGESSGPMHLALGPCQRDVVVCCGNQGVAERYIEEDNWFDNRVKTYLRKDLTPAAWAAALVRMVGA